MDTDGATKYRTVIAGNHATDLTWQLDVWSYTWMHGQQYGQTEYTTMQ